MVIEEGQVFKYYLVYLTTDMRENMDSAITFNIGRIFSRSLEIILDKFRYFQEVDYLYYDNQNQNNIKKEINDEIKNENMEQFIENLNSERKLITSPRYDENKINSNKIETELVKSTENDLVYFRNYRI